MKKTTSNGCPFLKAILSSEQPYFVSLGIKPDLYGSMHNLGGYRNKSGVPVALCVMDLLP